MKKKRVKKKRIAKANKHGKTVVHSVSYWNDQELDDWEKEQHRVAYKYLKRENLKLKTLIVDAKRFSFSLPCLNADAVEKIEDGTYENYFKDLNVEHLKNSDGVVIYWGTIYDAPKPRLLKNGARSPEDIILNPGKIKSDYANAKTRQSAAMLTKLMRRLGIQDKRIRIKDSYTPVKKEKSVDKKLSDAGKKHLEAFSEKFEPVKPKLAWRDKCKNCGSGISPLLTPLVTSWQSVDGVMRPKSVWCKNCEHIGKKIAKKRRNKKRKLRKLEDRKLLKDKKRKK